MWLKSKRGLTTSAIFAEKRYTQTRSTIAFSTTVLGENILFVYLVGMARIWILRTRQNTAKQKCSLLTGEDGDTGDGNDLKKDELIKKIDYTTPEKIAETERIDRERQEALKREEEAERKRVEKEKAEEEKRLSELAKLLYPVKKQPKIEYKPSRLIDVDTDTTIMNMEIVLNLVKETVEHIENMLWDIQDYLFRNDKKKREALRLKRLKRKVKR
jgi:hypothetical protein